MANYRPTANTVATAANISGTVVFKNIATSVWGMALLKGTAVDPAGAPLTSGAVEVWQSNQVTTSAPSHTTFADQIGQYGVTVKAHVPLIVKFYGK